jgi:hypothetical protein
MAGRLQNPLLMHKQEYALRCSAHCAIDERMSDVHG